MFEDSPVNSTTESLVEQLTNFQEHFQLKIKVHITISEQDGEKRVLRNRWSSFEQEIDIVPKQLAAVVSLLSTPAMASLQKNVIVV